MKQTVYAPISIISLRDELQAGGKETKKARLDPVPQSLYRRERMEWAYRSVMRLAGTNRMDFTIYLSFSLFSFEFHNQ